MSKFKVEDRVRNVGYPDWGRLGEVGTVIEVDKTSCPYWVRFSDGGRLWLTESQLEPEHQAESIHITRDGSTVQAVHKRNGEVVQHSTAKCSPSDTFDFAVGADLAYQRLMHKPDKPGKQDKPAEPAKEPVKLYCVKDMDSGLASFTKWKSYSFDPSIGGVADDTGERCGNAKSFSEWKDKNPTRMACLVPLVKRPAKKGEYIIVTNMDDFAYYDGRFDMGDILRVTEDDTNIIDQWKGRAVGFENVTHPDRPHCPYVIVNKDYLVLDGYQPEPEKPEPKYWSGKVVCIEANNYFLTLGKVYTFNNGLSTDDDGDVLPYSSIRIMSIDHLNATLNSRFIEFKE